MNALATHLRLMRERAGFTSRTEFARTIGLSEGAVRHIESGRNEPPLSTVERWAALCGLDAHVTFTPRESR